MASNGPEAASKVTWTGLASMYGKGDGFAWRRTASGQIMDPTKLTAASVLTRTHQGKVTNHTLIPIGSTVTVTRTDDKTVSVEVTINDDGPLEPGRIIDLSPAAMGKLNYGFQGGLVPVTVTLVR